MRRKTTTSSSSRRWFLYLLTFALLCHQVVTEEDQEAYDGEKDAVGWGSAAIGQADETDQYVDNGNSSDTGEVDSNVNEELAFVNIELNPGDAKSACDRLTTGETSILTLGPLSSAFLILTSDLYLYELNHLEPDLLANPLNADLRPPYSILVETEPTHLSQRLPAAYPYVANLTETLLYVYLAGNHPESGPNEYLVFVYTADRDGELTICQLALDLGRDTALETFCSPILVGYLPVKYEPGDRSNYVFVPLLGQRKSLSFCPLASGLLIFTSVTESTLKKMKTESEIKSSLCSGSIDQCAALFRAPIPLPGLPQLKPGQYVPGLCDNVSSRVVTGYTFQNVFHLIDVTGTVHSMAPQGREEGGFKFGSRRPLSQFLGCNIKAGLGMWEFDSTTIYLIFAAVVTLQLVICAGCIFYFRRLFVEKPGVAGKAAGKRKSHKRVSKSSKSPSSLGGSKSLAGGSAKSRSSLSRRSSKSRRSTMASKSTGGDEKTLGLSRGSKSRASKSRASKSRASKSVVTVSKSRVSHFPPSGSESLSNKSRASKSRASKSRASKSRASKSRL